MEELIKGILIGEKKNRFLCDVLIEGKQEECYISSSCRLDNFFDTNHCEVLLRPTQNTKARTKYAVYAIKSNDNYILVDLRETNKIIASHIEEDCFSFLGERKLIQKEKNIEGYKADLYLEETKTIIEIKSIISNENNVKFPQIRSDRAIMQLNRLEELIQRGYRVCYLFVSLCPEVNVIELNEQYEDYCTYYRSCVRQGMLSRSYSIGINSTTNANGINKELEVVIN